MKRNIISHGENSINHRFIWAKNNCEKKIALVYVKGKHRKQVSNGFVHVCVPVNCHHLRVQQVSVIYCVFGSLALSASPCCMCISVVRAFFFFDLCTNSFH